MQTFESALYAADRFAICTLLIDLYFRLASEARPMRFTGDWGAGQLDSIDHLLWSGPHQFCWDWSDCSFGWFSVGFFGCSANWTCRLGISSCLSIDNFGQISVFGKLVVWIQSSSLWQWTLHQDHLQVKSRSLAGQIKITWLIVS